jgi:hypothetical protein
MISGNKSVTKRAFYCIQVDFLGAKVTILFGMTKQKSNFLLLHIWSLPTIMQHHTPHLEPQQSQRDAGSLNYHRACQLPIMPEKHRQSKADAARGMHTTSVLPTSCSIHLGAIEKQSQSKTDGMQHTSIIPLL